MISKQLLLGIGLVLGGGILAAALNGGDDATTKQNVEGDVAHPKVEPLKQDIQTERHLSEQKRKDRENKTLAQEQQAKEFVEEQERVKQQLATQPATPSNVASANTVANTNTTVATNNTINESINTVVSEVSTIIPNSQPTMPDEMTVQVRPDAIVATKKAEEKKRKQQAYVRQQKINATKSGQHVISHGDSLSQLSREYNVPISAIISANNLVDADTLIAGDILIIPGKSTKQAKKPNTETKVRTEKEKKSNNKSNKDSASTKARNVKPFYSVQVSLADSDAKASELVRKYRAAGYKVQTSRTNRGVRVLVGSASNAEEANKLKAKLSKDSRVNAGDAWVKRVDTLNP